MENGKKFKSSLLQPRDIIENAIGFSNKWMSLFWGCLFYYILYANRNLQNARCDDLILYTQVQCFFYLLQYVNILLVTEQLVQQQQYRDVLQKSKYIICFSNLLLSVHNFILAFYANQSACQSIQSLNRVHGLFLFIYVILGFLFAFLIFVQISVLKDRQNKRK